MVLHCSAGLGRSGVLATIHSCLECHVDRRNVDIHRTVTNFQRQRKDIIQTQEQYRLCYEAIAEALLPADMDQELIQQPDSRPVSYPPPPYREKDEEKSVSKDSSPPPPTASPPPPISEPTTPIKVPLPETPPSTTPPSRTPSRPVSDVVVGESDIVEGFEGEDATERLVATAKNNDKVEAESPKVEVEPSKEVKPKNLEPKEGIQPRSCVTGSSEPGETIITIPLVLVTAPSTEQLDKIEDEEEIPPSPPTSPPPLHPSLTDFPLPPESTTPPSLDPTPADLPAPITPSPLDPTPADLPAPITPPPTLEAKVQIDKTSIDVGQPEQEAESEEGFSISDDQVITEKPYKKGDEKIAYKKYPSNQPKWKHPSSKRTTSSQTSTKWKYQQQRQGDTPSAGSAQLPVKQKWKFQQRMEEEVQKRSAPEMVVQPDSHQPSTRTEQKLEDSVSMVVQDARTDTQMLKSPKRVGKLKIPAIFTGGSEEGTQTKTSSGNKSGVIHRVGHVELIKSDSPHPTPNSSPAVRRKWQPTTIKQLDHEEKDESPETESTPPALKKLKQLQQKRTLSSLSSSPVYKLPTLPSKFQSQTQKMQSDSDAKTDSNSEIHNTDTSTGNVARLLMRFQ